MSSKLLQPNRLTAALLAALILPLSQGAIAQETEEDTSETDTETAVRLDRLTVTGSLIPRTEIETATPVTVITADDIRVRGFIDVGDALKSSSFATGSVQGSQSSASFTQGAETLSLFGLSPSYVKYLIDGRPMANYPALYNGSDVFNNISGIPVDLVDRIEILPGGQSSLYGSDAIAGVVNIILRKRLDQAVVSARYGVYDDGGGTSRRVSLADSFGTSDGSVNVLVGAQYEKSDPIWAYDRDVTSRFFTEGTSPAVASRDYLLFSGLSGTYVFADPNNCANVTSQFGGTTEYQNRPGFGEYCGSMFTPGYRTLRNGKESSQFYTHATFEVNPNLELYTDFLYSRETVEYHVGSNYTWWGSSVKWGYYYDPVLDDFLQMQRAFSPEDMGPGGYANTMSRDESASYAMTFGARGTFGESMWDYDFLFQRTQYKLDEFGLARLADPINDYFQNTVLGPQLGVDPYLGFYPVFSPNYDAFYRPMSPADFASFTGYTRSESRTWDNMLRAQVTNGSLFSMAGGDAGIAVAVEGGNQSWNYTPDERLMDGRIWGTTAVSGGGDRSRYAATTELRLPILDSLTLSASGRYDNFRVAGDDVNKATYSASFEWRPFQPILVRGKYGTAFKAPTLSDQFQGLSGFYSFVTDYYNCELLGYGPDEVENCPARYSSRQYFGQQAGNPDLDPITADVWSAGIVYAPTANLSFSADYLYWDLANEVNRESADTLALTEMRCRTGQEDVSSPSCQAALSQITRNQFGEIDSIFTPKVNVSRQTLRAINVGANWAIDMGNAGGLNLQGNYTNNLSHERQSYPQDPEIDLLRRPGWSSAPKAKANLSATWALANFSTTLYANYISSTPSYVARVTDAYEADNAFKLGSWTTYNMSMSYSFFDNLRLSLLVNNLTNKQPVDHTYPGTSGAPYNSGQYSAFGRSYMLEARYRFGGR